MTYYDITQELLSCEVYAGDPAPQLTALRRMDAGDVYNLSALSLCLHNGTHVDAPFHFFADGKTVEQLPAETFVGSCYVAHTEGDLLSADDARAILQAAAQAGADRRILLGGPAVVTEGAAAVFAGARLLLLGCEGQSVGPIDAPMAVHRILLSAEVALLEGLVLQNVPAGRYHLAAAPLLIKGADGAPCRAVLVGE